MFLERFGVKMLLILKIWLWFLFIERYFEVRLFGFFEVFTWCSWAIDYWGLLDLYELVDFGGIEYIGELRIRLFMIVICLSLLLLIMVFMN